MTNKGGGFNTAAFLDAALSESLSTRFLVGTGKTDFYVSGGAKWIPFPDVDRQPALGIKASLWYARTGSINTTTLQIAPMVSKKYQTEHGLLIPYAAYGLNNFREEGHSGAGDQFFLGADWRNDFFGNMNLTGELALSLKDSTSGVSFFLSFPFDNKHGFGAN